MPFSVRGVLVLVVEVFEPLGETDGGEALLIEAGVVPSAAEAIAPEDHDGMEGWNHTHGHVVGLAGRCAGRETLRGGVEVSVVDFDDGAGELAGGRVVLGADGLDFAELLQGGWAGDALGEDANGRFVCADCAGSGVASDDVVVEDGFEVPAFGLREFGEVTAAVEALLFAGDGEEDDGAGELEFGEDASGFEGDSGAAGVVVGAGRGVVGVEVVGVA